MLKDLAALIAPMRQAVIMQTSGDFSAVVTGVGLAVKARVFAEGTSRATRVLFSVGARATGARCAIA